MESKELISKDTELAPADILRNRKGKFYKIETFHNNKNTFKLSPWPAKPGDENPSYLILEKDALVLKQWEKVDKSELTLPSNGELQLSEHNTEDELDSLIIKEERPSKEESVDF